MLTVTIKLIAPRQSGADMAAILEQAPGLDLPCDPLQDQKESSKRPIKLRFLLGALLAISACSWLGTALAPLLYAHHPLLVLVLAPRSTFVVAFGGRLPVAELIALLLIRLSLADPIYYYIGRHYGRQALNYKQKRQPRFLKKARKMLLAAIKRYGLWLVFLRPTGQTMVPAGVAKLKPSKVAVANLGGTLLQVMWLVYFTPVLKRWL